MLEMRVGDQVGDIDIGGGRRTSRRDQRGECRADRHPRSRAAAPRLKPDGLHRSGHGGTQRIGAPGLHVECPESQLPRIDAARGNRQMPARRPRVLPVDLCHVGP